jgi:chromosome segregation ATPase
VIEAAVAPLREQLDYERTRADRAEQQIEMLRGELAEVRTTERVATTEAAELRRRLDQADADHRQVLDRLAAAQEQVTALLTNQRAAPAAPARRSWLPWRRRA